MQSLKAYKILTNKRFVIVGIIVVLHIFVIVGKLIYNKMVDEEHFLHIAKGEVQVALIKRAELVKTAQATVEEYVQTEGRLMHHLIELAKAVKSGADARRIMAMQDEILRLIASLDILVMKAPDLKSKGPYKYLMDIMTETENEVLKAIQRYNLRASEFNMFIYKIPYNLVARLYGFKPAKLFNAVSDNLDSPNVDAYLAMEVR